MSGKHEILGQHESGVKCLEWVPSLGAVVSAGWDCKLCVWDARGRAGQPPRYSVELPGKAYSSSLSSSGRLVVATARRKLAVLDVGTLPGASASASDGAAAPAAPRMDVLDSPLRHQTRAVRCFPDGTGFALGSVEGRVAMEFWDEGHDAARYAFKCHRGPAADGSGDTIYPVHALAFHEPYGTFASGGGDGCVAAWDGQRKKRLALWQGYPTSIAALAFNKTGTLLAVASSYAFEQVWKGVRLSREVACWFLDSLLCVCRCSKLARVAPLARRENAHTRRTPSTSAA